MMKQFDNCEVFCVHNMSNFNREFDDCNPLSNMRLARNMLISWDNTFLLESEEILETSILHL